MPARLSAAPYPRADLAPKRPPTFLENSAVFPPHSLSSFSRDFKFFAFSLKTPQEQPQLGSLFLEAAALNPVRMLSHHSVFLTSPSHALRMMWLVLRFRGLFLRGKVLRFPHRPLFVVPFPRLRSSRLLYVFG